MDTIFEIFGFALAPRVEFFALRFRITSNTVKVKSDTLFGGDYFLRRGRGAISASSAVNKRPDMVGIDVRILLTECADLVGDAFKCMGSVSSLRSSLVGRGLIADVRAARTIMRGQMGS